MKGYDHAFLLQAQGNARTPVARLWSQDEKLQMVVYTSAPALQFYSGNFLGGTPSRGPDAYEDWQGLALESGFSGQPKPSRLAAAGLLLTPG